MWNWFAILNDCYKAYNWTHIKEIPLEKPLIGAAGEFMLSCAGTKDVRTNPIFLWAIEKEGGNLGEQIVFEFQSKCIIFIALKAEETEI